MPRPKSKTSASSKLNVKNPRVTQSTSAHSPRPQLEMVTTAPDRVTSASDDSEGLVKTERSRVSQKRAVNPTVTMSGALAREETGGGLAKPITGRKRAALFKITRNADHERAIEALKARRDAALAAEKQTEVQVQVQVPSSIPTVPIGAVAPVTEDHQKDLDFVTESQSVPATPRVGRAATIRGSNFKRRPRQPSLLQLVRAQASNLPDEKEDDDLDDFHPDDESTPFFQGKSQLLLSNSSSTSPVPTASHSGSRKRKLSSPVVQVKKSQSPEPRASSATAPSVSSDPDTDEDLYKLFPSSIHNDHPEPSLPLPRAQPAPPSNPWSDTCAPPQSTSSTGTPHSPDRATQPLQRNNKSERNPPRVPSPTASRRPLKPLSTAKLQNLLPRRRVRASTLNGHGPFDMPSSSNDHSSSDIEIDTSRLSAEADELSVSAKTKVRKRRGKTQALGSMAAKPKPKPKPHLKSKQPSRAPPGRKKKPVPIPLPPHNRLPPATTTTNTTATSKKKAKTKTYSTSYPRTAKPDPHHPHETENQNDDSDSDPTRALPPHLTMTTTPSTAAKTELQRLSHIFQEVDQWELEVEDVTPSSGS